MTGVHQAKGGNDALGYRHPAGDTVTQLTDRTTDVEINALCGQITTDDASLAVETGATFTVNNNLVEETDTIVLSQQSGSDGGNTSVNVVAVADGSFDIQVSNNNAGGGTAETGAIVINFAVIKAVTE